MKRFTNFLSRVKARPEEAHPAPVIEFESFPELEPDAVAKLEELNTRLYHAYKVLSSEINYADRRIKEIFAGGTCRPATMLEHSYHEMHAAYETALGSVHSGWQTAHFSLKALVWLAHIANRE